MTQEYLNKNYGFSLQLPADFVGAAVHSPHTPLFMQFTHKREKHFLVLALGVAGFTVSDPDALAQKVKALHPKQRLVRCQMGNVDGVRVEGIDEGDRTFTEFYFLTPKGVVVLSGVSGRETDTILASLRRH